MNGRRRGEPAEGGETTAAGVKRIGLREVAAAAGVSTATVSRVVNKPDTVSDALRGRIEEVIGRLGWVPSGTARALVTRQTNTVGAVFPALALGDFARAIDALEDELATRNYTLLLARSRYVPAHEHRQVMKLVERGVDGIILVGASRAPQTARFLAQSKVPVVNTFVYHPDSAVPCIGPDNRAALHSMTNYLVSLGHRRFAMIAQSTANNDRAAARREGVLAALAEHGLSVAPNHLVEGQWTIAEGRQLLRRITAQRPWPTAVLCGNSLLAVGAMLESQAMGIAVPEDMSIVGYDDIEIMRELPIPVTTVRVASDEVGRQASRVIVDLIEGQNVGAGIELPAEIVVRRSSGPPPRENPP